MDNNSSTSASLTLEGLHNSLVKSWELKTIGDSVITTEVDLSFINGSTEKVKFTEDGGIEFGGGNFHPPAYDRQTVMVSGKVNSGGTNNTSATTFAYISSTTRNSEGVYTINFVGGTFADEPVLTVTPFSDVGDSLFAVIEPISTTSFQVKIRNSGGSLRDASFNFIAIGER